MYCRAVDAYRGNIHGFWRECQWKTDMDQGDREGAASARLFSHHSVASLGLGAQQGRVGLAEQVGAAAHAVVVFRHPG